MKWAVGILLLSCLITAVGVLLVFTRVNSGLVNSETGSISTGAFTGKDAATPTGDSAPPLRNQNGLNITATAIIREITAAAATRTPRASDVPAVKPVAVGQAVTVGDSRFIVHQVLDPEPPGLFKTSAGKRRVAIEVTQEALASRQQYHFAQFKLSDTGGKTYTWAITNGDPTFSSGSLAPGESRRGWISFEVPDGAGLQTLVFQRLTETVATPIVDLR